MELLILPDQFIIQYKPFLMFILLLTGLVLFFLSKLWRKKYKESNRFGFKPSVLFIVSFIFIMGGIHFFVYKIVFNKDKIILFNIQDFNRQLEWKMIDKVEYEPVNQVMVYMKTIQNEAMPNGSVQNEQPILIDLKRLDPESMDKVKILIAYKLKQSQKSIAKNNKKPIAEKILKPLSKVKETNL